MKLTEKYSCGHLRTEKGKHLCPECRLEREEQRRSRSKKDAGAKVPVHRPRKVVSVERKAAALERIGKAIDGAKSRKEIADRLGKNLSRQRIAQMIRFWEKATGQTLLPPIGTKPGIARKNRTPKPPKAPKTCGAPLPESGRFCRRRKGHIGPHGHWVSWNFGRCGHKDEGSGWVCNRREGHVGKHRYVAELSDGPRLLEWFECQECKDSKVLKCYVAFELCNNCPPNARPDFLVAMKRKIVKALSIDSERIEVTEISQARLHLACGLPAEKTG